MIKCILTTLLLLSSSLTQAHTPTPNGVKDSAQSTISECIAATTSKTDLLECMKNRNTEMDTEDDHAVVKCLLNSDDERIYWYEDCIRG